MLVSELSRLSITIPSVCREAVLNLLAEQGHGVEEQDEQTLNPSGPGETVLVVWLPSDAVEPRVRMVEVLLASLKAMGLVAEPWSWKSELADESTWKDVYKEHFPVIHLGRNLVVKPSWREYQPLAHELLLELDPGMAFGTGLHASTSLMARALEHLARMDRAPGRVLDIGTGTGILAMSAARLWPDAQILAVDNDPVAVDVCRSNVERNHLGDQVTVELRSMLELDPPQRFHLVLSNLNRSLLLELQPRAGRLLADLGNLIVGGLLVEEGPEIARAFSRDLLFEPRTSEEQDGWQTIHFRVRS